MSGSGRKRLSKWDLREESHLEDDIVQDDGWPMKDSRPGWISPEIASDNDEANDISKSKQDWGLFSREPLRGCRVSHKEGYSNKGYSRNMQDTAEWDDDKSYGTRMSPGLDGWRRHSSNLSDRNDWSRSVRGRGRSRSRSRSQSRSRSPNSLKPDSGFYDRNRNKPRLSTQLCRDFASGRCRRGNSCPFLHQDNQNLDDSWENRNRKGRALRSTPHDYRDYPRSGRSADQCTDFVKGRCQRGASCWYSHDSALHELSRGSSNDINRARENDRSKEVYFSRGEREPSCSGIVICKFFAAGNCRNGRNCKFSHHSQTRASPERKSSSDSWEQVHDDRERLWDGPKSSELASGSDVTQLRENNNEQTGGREPRYTWSSEHKWGHGLNNGSKSCKTHSNQAANIKALQNNKNETFLCKAADAGTGAAGIGTPDPRGLGKWPTDMEMSPDWHFTVQPSNHVVKGDGNIMQDSISQTSMGLATLSHEIAQEALAKKKDVPTEPMTVGNSYFRQNLNLMQDITIASALNDNIINDRTIASHAEGNSSGNILHGQRLTYHTDHPGGTVMNPESQNENASMQGINSGTTITPNIVTSEQLTQLTNLSVSLAQYLGNGEPLPQLFASLNPHKATETSSFTYSDALMGALVASIKSDPVIECLKQRDPICNSTELKKLEIINTPSDCSLNPTGQRSVTNGKQEVQIADLPLSSDPCGNTGISVEEALRESLVTNPAKPAVDSEAIKEKNGDEDCENKTVQRVNESSQENGAAEKLDGNDGVHDKKKSKDAKGVRAFKFALVEFVKELLKPTWKDGHISKDVYKTIVKKVVDKVTVTMQGGHIPQTPEKIDHYLSISKSRLTKLVQAYVDKVQKT